VPIPVPAPMSPAAATPAPMSLPAPRMAAPTATSATPRDWPRVMFMAVLRSMVRLKSRPELRVAGWNREIEVLGPVVGVGG